jgi:hypothetical protein
MSKSPIENVRFVHRRPAARSLAASRECLMKVLALIILASSLGVAAAAPSLAHGDKPHPNCKKGYALNDDHKCVKKN